MDLYFSPLAGSLAARIALYEAGAEARFIEDSPDRPSADHHRCLQGLDPQNGPITVRVCNA